MVDFLIWAPAYDNNSGGIIALHKLADLLAKQGENAYIYTEKTFEGSSAKVIGPGSNIQLTVENTMAIYPEIIIGNPFGTPFVTRWLLNTPGVCGGDGVYGENDLVFKYYDYFNAPDESKVKGELRTFTLKLDKFFNKNLERNGECFIVKKGRGKTLDKHASNSINIDTYISDDYLIDVFNKTERFIAYDSMTFHIQQAALCGCLPIVIPDEGVSKEEFIRRAPINKYGMAYGFDDVEHAKATLHLMESHLKDMENESLELVKNYIKCCYNHMYKNNI